MPSARATLSLNLGRTLCWYNFELKYTYLDIPSDRANPSVNSGRALWWFNFELIYTY